MHTSLKPRAAVVAVAAALASLSGCITTAPIKDILDNREQYLTANFNATKLTPPVRSAIESGPPIRLGFKRMKLQYKVEQDDDGRKKTLDNSEVLLNAGNGLVQLQNEFSNNGIPYRINNSLTFVGVFPMMWQAAFHAYATSQPAFEVASFKRFDRNVSAPVPGEEYVLEGSSLATGQPGVGTPVKTVCKAADKRPASSYHAKFTGQAVPLECKAFNLNQTPILVQTLAFLVDYGLAVTVSNSSSNTKSTYQIIDVEITR